MTKPDDIPQDVWQTAQYICTQESIARAIMAEREACAAIAEIIAGHKPAEPVGTPWAAIHSSAMEIGIKTAGIIAAAIRNRRQ